MSRHRVRRSAVSASVAAVAVLAGSAAGGAYLTGRSPDHAPAAAASVSSGSPAATAPAAAATGEEPVVDRDTELAAAVEPLLTGSGAVSVAVLDTGTGTRAVYGGADASYDTASIVKVDILAALLLRAQDEGRELTAGERAHAVAMIERSDNDSATALLAAVGGAAGLDAANARLGLTGTTAAQAWGLTRTTAADQLTLLEAVFGTEADAELGAASRTYLRGLMAQVEADQQWGVSAAGSDWALKNGWMPRTATGLWNVNSIGQVTAGGHTVLVAVLSGGQASKETGIALVESVARAAVGVVRAG
ncbi:serine hydrolase [Streptomyces sp. NBC_00338]|uniref:serine hydrolase n=1 Tax=unclassified Streptomyces TaxID=2593676 RepID=UPI00224FB64A|nr:serine hydrolase [Streptomyces sp. NBC_00338]MCX5139113.1 serine hydrolase [Streptomyces sp. NBC_00338]WSU57777.1 serine hydrolase [Streptomyces sp. NBC_01104]